MRSRPDPFAIAAEHVAWCLREGFSINDVLRAIGAGVVGNETWNDVIWAIAKAQDEMDPRLVAAPIATVFLPFRKRDPVPLPRRKAA